MMDRVMTWDEWESEFRPIARNGHTFLETFGEDLETVNAADPLRVWTVIDGGSVYLDIVNGRRFINRLNYVITERPAEPGAAYLVTNRTDN